MQGGENIPMLDGEGARIRVPEWFKKREVALFFVFFLISSLSFGIGYLLAKQENIAPIIIEKGN